MAAILSRPQCDIEAQNGFRCGRSTVDSAFVLYSLVNEYLQQGKKLYTFFIDYSKAFDYIVPDNDECDRYAEITARLIPRYYWVRASMYKCIQLLSSNHRKTARLLSKYVYLAFRTVQ